MKILIVFLAVIVGIALLLLFSRVWLISDVVLNNFNAEAKFKIKLFMLPVMKFNSAKKPKRKKNKKTKEKAETKKNVSLKDIKDNIFKIIPILSDLVRDAVKIRYFETDITVALSDPMNTGLAYSAVSAAANIFYKSVKMKKCFLDVRYDFDSEQGLIIKHKSKIYVRPISILKAYIKLKSL